MKQLSLLTGNKELVLSSKISKDEITDEIAKKFDYVWEGEVKEIIEIPTFPTDFEIGVIVGSSGSGKSTIMKNEFGEEENVEWDNSKCIASNFATFEEASSKFGAVGLNSIPTWLKPYRVLSNGEKFRADMARRLHNNSVIDEFTSVVNREVAISCSCSIEKYIRKNGLHNIVFCSCHDDILPYLRPSWVYNTDTHEFYSGRYLQRPQITIELSPCSFKAWNMFKKHHYMSGAINNAAVCFMAKYDGVPVAFIAVLYFLSGVIHRAWREHRVVVLPDFQGMGIGNKLSETIAQAFIEKGCRYFSRTANPRMGEHRNKSKLWRGTSSNGKMNSYFDKENNISKFFSKMMKRETMEAQIGRICYSHEYIGDGTKYPYTLINEDEPIEDKQLNLF